MRCIIVDDEEMSRVALEHLCNRIEGLKVVGVCKSGSEAINLLKMTDVDLMFLDIEMPHITGMEIVKELDKLLPQIIFTTSKKDYAHQAYEYDVTDFLVKPIFFARLVKAVERARLVMERRKNQND